MPPGNIKNGQYQKPISKRRARPPTPFTPGEGQVGPCLTDVVHRPLPACCSWGAATLKPEQKQQRLERHVYPVASSRGPSAVLERPTHTLSRLGSRAAASWENRLKSWASIASLSSRYCTFDTAACRELVEADESGNGAL